MGFLQPILDSEEIIRRQELSEMATGMQLAEESHKYHLRFLRQQRNWLDIIVGQFESQNIETENHLDHQERILRDCQVRWNKMGDSEKESEDGKLLTELIEAIEKNIIPTLKNREETPLYSELQRQRDELTKSIAFLEK